MRMTVADLMTERPVTVLPDCSADCAIDILYRTEVTELYVTDQSGRLLGVLPDYELLKAQLSGESREATAEQLMSRGIPVFSPEADAAEVARLFRDARFSRFPIVRAGRLVGIITRGDILRLMAVLRRIEAPTPVKAPKLIASRTRTRRGRPTAKPHSRGSQRRGSRPVARVSNR